MSLTSSNAISKKAARWYIRMRAAEIDVEDQRNFEAWLKANPAHQKEYASIAETMQDLTSNDKLTALADALEHKQFTAKQLSKQKVSGVAAKLATLIMIGFITFLSLNQYQAWQSQPLLQLATNNPIGQISTQTLADGSNVTLSANSEMQVTFYRHQRHVRLQRGEAIFEVTKDIERPFVVETDTTKVTVLGTRFAINKLSKLVRVSVDHGRVQVESKSPKQSVIITDGQVVEIKTQQAPDITHKNATDAFSILQGKLIFAAADTDEVADTLSRYRTMPVITQGHTTSNISAVINTKDAEQFLQGLPNIAAVKVKQLADKTVLVSTSINGEKR
jgi:transmembrane sensor